MFVEPELDQWLPDFVNGFLMVVQGAAALVVHFCSSALGAAPEDAA
jgi:hypothetical protein